MPKRAVFERSRREVSLDVSVGVNILFVVEQSSTERQSRGCAKIPILMVLQYLGGALIPFVAVGRVEGLPHVED